MRQWTVHAAAVRFDLHVPESRSLKAKRAAIRPIVDGLRHRFQVSVAEVDHQDQWQRAAIGVARGRRERRAARARCSASVERFVGAAPDVELLDIETAWLETRAGVTTAPAAPSATRAPRGSTRSCSRCSPTSSSGCPTRGSGFVTLTGVEVSPRPALRRRLLLGARRPPSERVETRRTRCARPRPHLRACSAGRCGSSTSRELRFREDPGDRAGPAHRGDPRGSIHERRPSR